MSKTIDLLQERKREILKGIETLNADLADIDAAISAVTNRSVFRGAITNSVASDNPSLSVAKVLRARQMSINDAIIAALENGGGSAIEVYRYISDKLNVSTTLNSVNTRLSRLKSEGRIGHDGKRWKPILKKDVSSAKKLGPELPVPAPEMAGSAR